MVIFSELCEKIKNIKGCAINVGLNCTRILRCIFMLLREDFSPLVSCDDSDLLKQTLKDERARKASALEPNGQSHKFFCDFTSRQLMPECIRPMLEMSGSRTL